jgi:hypothetical protein
MFEKRLSANQLDKHFTRYGLAVAVLTVFLAPALRGLQAAPNAAAINPDQGRMGSYRALAQLADRAYAAGDDATAAVLARILERTWDQGEWRNTSPGAYCTANKSDCQPIDAAMDGFVKPLTGYSRNGRPDASKEQASLATYLKALAAADWIAAGSRLTPSALQSGRRVRTIPLRREKRIRMYYPEQALTIEPALRRHRSWRN